MPNPLRLALLGLVAFTLTGCESTRWNWLKREPTGTTAKPAASASVKSLVEYLNDNAKRVRSLRVEDLDVDASMDSQSFNLRGRIYAEKPKNFRMKVTLFGKDEVDIGSNPQEFWFWAAKNPEKYQYFCSYNDMNAGRLRMMPLPIQPEWVMETLGLGPFGPADKYQLQPEGVNLIHLVERMKAPDGKMVRKVIVMNRKETKAPQPQITAFLLLDDASGQEICSAHITSTTQDRASGAILPYRMELRVPSQKMKLALRLDGMAINPQMQATAFQRTQMAGVEQFNLATGRPEPWLQRAGGFQK